MFVLFFFPDLLMEPCKEIARLAGGRQERGGRPQKEIPVQLPFCGFGEFIYVKLRIDLVRLFREVDCSSVAKEDPVNQSRSFSIVAYIFSVT